MTENEIKSLKFEKVEVSAEESGDKPYYFYTHDVVNGLSFISNSSDDVKDGEWFVEFFNTEIPVRFNDMSQVSNLIEILTKAILHEK